MKLPFCFPKKYFVATLSLCCILLLNLQAIRQGSNCPNPTFPTCQTPAGQVFKVMLVLDESGSVARVREHFKQAVRDFARVLSEGATELGQFEMGIAEFNNSAQLEMALTDVLR